MRVDFVAAVAASSVMGAVHPKGATPAAHGAATGDVFAQILAALGQHMGATDPSAVLPVTNLALANLNAKAAQPAPSPTPAAIEPPDPQMATTDLRALTAALQNHSAQPPAIDLAKLRLQIKTAPTQPKAASQTSVPAEPQLAQLLAAQPQASPIQQVIRALSAGENGRAGPAIPSPAITSATNSAPPSAGPAKAAPAKAEPALLPATPSDKLAAAIVPSGTTPKPEHASRPDEAASTADNIKSQVQGSAASVLAALSTANSRTFTEQPVSSTSALPIHAGADHGGSNTPGGNGSNGQSAHGQSPHGQNPPSTNQVHTDAPASPAPQQTQIADNRPASPPPPPADAASVAATNGVNQNGSATNLAPVPVHANLQVVPASTMAVPDPNALAVSIMAKSQGGSKHFDIRLDPPELGRVDVRLTVDDAGKAQASLAVEKPQTLELLQKDSTTLERALKDAGLDLSQNGLNFSLRGQQQQSANGESPRGRALNVQAVAAIETPVSPISMGGVSASDTRLDIRV